LLMKAAFVGIMKVNRHHERLNARK
jgi:hypothetical protein